MKTLSSTGGNCGVDGGSVAMTVVAVAAGAGGGGDRVSGGSSKGSDGGGSGDGHALSGRMIISL